jgi:hypothetical protein
MLIKQSRFLIHYAELNIYNLFAMHLLNSISLLNGCRIAAKSPLKILCVGFVADLQRIAGTTVE